MRGNLLEIVTVQKTIRFQFPKLLCQGGFRDPAHPAVQLAEAVNVYNWERSKTAGCAEEISRGIHLHFTGRTWRPPYEAHSVIIQATSGCAYAKCRFCSLYKDGRFRLSPMEEFEAELAEIKGYQPYARRTFWTGANPFAMNYENLKLRALTVRDYLIKCRTMAMFCSIRDIKDKERWQFFAIPNQRQKPDRWCKSACPTGIHRV